jgi:hypothetical protein
LALRWVLTSFSRGEGRASLRWQGGAVSTASCWRMGGFSGVQLGNERRAQQPLNIVHPRQSFSSAVAKDRKSENESKQRRRHGTAYLLRVDGTGDSRTTSYAELCNAQCTDNSFTLSLGRRSCSPATVSQAEPCQCLSSPFSSSH